jgi:hypothetical protein
MANVASSFLTFFGVTMESRFIAEFAWNSHTPEATWHVDKTAKVVYT